MLSAVSDDDDRPQWKIDEIILDTLEGLHLSDEEAKAEFERIRILDVKQIEEELARLEAKDDEFDPLVYVASNPDLIAAFGTDEKAAERHWEEIGRAEGRPTDEFDPLEYVASNPDLIAAFGGAEDPAEAATIHYIRTGSAEGRPTDEFDPEQYLDNYPDLIAAFGGAEDPAEAATIHYIRTGFAEGRTYEGPDEGGIEDEPLADAASAEWVPAGTATAPDFFL
jgi:hypothetical protein